MRYSLHDLLGALVLVALLIPFIALFVLAVCTIKWPRQFSLQSLLIVTTTAAVMLGLIAALR
jgi:hypothetical protein